MRGGAQQDAREHRVDGRRLARTGGAGDEQVRHLGEVRADRLARHVLAQPHGERRGVRRRLLEHVPETHDAPVGVGDLHTHGLLARYRSEDADVGRRQRVGEIVLQFGDVGHLRPRREPQLIARYVRASDRADHICLHVEVAERLEQARGRLALSRRVRPRLLSCGAREQLPGLGELPLKRRVLGHGVAQAPARGQLVLARTLWLAAVLPRAGTRAGGSCSRPLGGLLLALAGLARGELLGLLRGALEVG